MFKFILWMFLIIVPLLFLTSIQYFTEDSCEVRDAREQLDKCLKLVPNWLMSTKEQAISFSRRADLEVSEAEELKKSVSDLQSNPETAQYLI